MEERWSRYLISGAAAGGAVGWLAIAGLFGEVGVYTVLVIAAPSAAAFARCVGA